MRLPWVGRRKYEQEIRGRERSAQRLQGERDRLDRSHAGLLRRNLELLAARDSALRERDEALARAADLERALGQFSAGEAATDDLCDCPVSVVNEHLTGYCGTARLEASKAGTPCPPTAPARPVGSTGPPTVRSTRTRSESTGSAMADMRERCRVCDGDGVAYEPYASYDTLVADTCPNCEGHGFVNS